MKNKKEKADDNREIYDFKIEAFFIDNLHRAIQMINMVRKYKPEFLTYFFRDMEIRITFKEEVENV